MHQIDSIFIFFKEVKTNDRKSTFAYELLNKTLDQILLNSINISYIKKFCKFFIYTDVRYFALKHLQSNFEYVKSNETFIEIFIKKIMIKFLEKLLPKMSNPLMCADFLNKSYQVVGLISILALDSLYVLISK
jgi:hypothetical protein